MNREKRESLKQLDRLVDPYRITKGKGFRLKDFDPADTGGIGSDRKPTAREFLGKGIQWLAEEQDKLYAQDRHSLRLVFQAMDAAGKDGTIRHVMSGVNPQGCQVFSFKQPSMEELDHDYLWRCQKCLPERGRIGIFNRSYYEEVLVVRVHRELLGREKLPQVLVTRDIWKERLEQPEKNWMFSPADVGERRHWDDYMAAYEDAIRRTATREAPWYVVPADNKWYTRMVVAAARRSLMREKR